MGTYVCVFGGEGGAFGTPGFRAAAEREGRGRRYRDYERTYDDERTILEGAGGRIHGGQVCYERAGSDAPRRLEALDIT
jgi:hypothetical protein